MYHSGKVGHVSDVLEHGFGDDESSRQFPTFLLLDDPFQDPFKVLHVVVLIPPHRAPADLDALANSKIDRAVRHNDIPSLAECRYDAGNGAECLSVNDACRRPYMRRNVGFGLNVDVLGAVEPWRRAGPHPVSPKDLYGALLQVWIGGEVIEVIRREVGDRTAIGEFGFRARRSVKAIQRQKVSLLPSSAYLCR